MCYLSVQNLVYLHLTKPAEGDVINRLTTARLVLEGSDGFARTVCWPFRAHQVEEQTLSSLLWPAGILKCRYFLVGLFMNTHLTSGGKNIRAYDGCCCRRIPTLFSSSHINTSTRENSDGTSHSSEYIIIEYILKVVIFTRMCSLDSATFV